jgi:alpha-glucosidase
MTGTPYLNQPHVHDILRRWRKVADEYADSPQGPRVFVAEAWVTPAPSLAQYIRTDELHTTFNFDALLCEWAPDSQRNVINLTLEALGEVRAPATWVLGNHDTIRAVSRYGRPITGLRFTPGGVDHSALTSILEGTTGPTEVELGRRRARAAVLLELALPGGAYVYQGDELGLEEVEDIPDELLQDPTWIRSGHTVRGRDGCRVPIPWSGDAPPFGFGSADQQPWLPQPDHWKTLTVEAQQADPDSSLNLYRAALAVRRGNPALGDGTLTWDTDVPAHVLSFRREPGFRCVVNFGPNAYELPAGNAIILASGPLDGHSLGADQSAWLQVS